jgi:hypothetical protein
MPATMAVTTLAMGRKWSNAALPTTYCGNLRSETVLTGKGFLARWQASHQYRARWMAASSASFPPALIGGALSVPASVKFPVVKKKNASF